MVNESESEAFFRETYGGMVGQKKVAVLEDPTLLKYSKKKNNGETTTTKAGFDSKNGTPTAPKRISESPVAATVIQQAPIRQQQQQEIIASDGRRRITPMANAPGTQVIACLLLRGHRSKLSLTMKIKCPEMYQLLLCQIPPPSPV